MLFKNNGYRFLEVGYFFVEKIYVELFLNLLSALMIPFHPFPIYIDAK